MRSGLLFCALEGRTASFVPNEGAKMDRFESLLADWRALGNLAPTNARKLAALRNSDTVRALLDVPHEKRISAGKACKHRGGLSWTAWLAACGQPLPSPRQPSTPEWSVWDGLRLTPDEIRSWRGWGLAPNEVKNWMNYGWTARLVGQWQLAGASIEEIRLWRDARWPPDGWDWFMDGWSPSEAHKWYKAGWASRSACQWRATRWGPTEAANWKNAGCGAEEAQEWGELGVPIEVAGAWRGASFYPPDTFAWIAAGISPEKAHAWRKDGRTAPDVAEWVLHKWLPLDASKWRQAGWTASETEWRDTGMEPNVARDWRDRGFAPGPAREWDLAGVAPGRVEEWMAQGWTGDEARPWSRAGLAPEVARTWHDAHVAPDDAQRWASQGWAVDDSAAWLSAGFAPSDALAWRDAGWSPEHGATWQACGLAPEDATLWCGAGWSPEESAIWERMGWTPVDAQTWQQGGWVPEEASSWRSQDFGEEEARAWHAAGFSASAAVEWHTAGWHTQTAAEWSGKVPVPAVAHAWQEAEFEPLDAERWIAHGWEPQSARLAADRGEEPVAFPSWRFPSGFDRSRADRYPRDGDSLFGSPRTKTDLGKWALRAARSAAPRANIAAALARDLHLAESSVAWADGDPTRYGAGDVPILRARSCERLLASGTEDVERTLAALALTATPYLVGPVETQFLIAGEPPPKELLAELRLPHPSALMVFGAEFQLDAKHAMRLPTWDSDAERSAIIIEPWLSMLADSGGSLFGVVLLADHHSRLSDDLIWMLRLESSGERFLIPGSRRASALASIADNLAASVAFSGWVNAAGPPIAQPTSPRPAGAIGDLDCVRPQIHVVQVRYRTNNARPGGRFGSGTAAHPRRGHWRRQPVGPRGQLQYEWRWIAPTWVGGSPPADDPYRVYRLPPLSPLYGHWTL